MRQNQITVRNTIYSAHRIPPRSRFQTTLFFSYNKKKIQIRTLEFNNQSQFYQMNIFKFFARQGSPHRRYSKGQACRLLCGGCEHVEGFKYGFSRSDIIITFYLMKQESKPSSFISKFHNILKVDLSSTQNKNFDTVIKFDEQNARIYVFDKQKLQLEILPYFFRHNKFTSFIRQLNLYGFKKIKNSPVLCFTHPILANGQKFLQIVAKKKLRPQPEEQQQPQEIQQNQQEINSVSYYNRLMNAQTSVVQPEHMLNRVMYTPQGYYPMLGNPLLNQNGVWGWGQSWQAQKGDEARYIMPIPGLYPGTTFINYFRSLEE